MPATEYEKMARRVARLEEMLTQVIRSGIVTDTDPAAHKVKVLFTDNEDLETQWLHVPVVKTHADKMFWLPDIDEEVLCFFYPLAREVGFVAGSLYNRVDPPPVDSQEKAHIRFLNGTWIEHDRDENRMQVHQEGEITIRATEKIVIGAPVVEIAGETVVVGAPSAVTLATPTVIQPAPTIRSGSWAPVKATPEPIEPEPYEKPELLEPGGCPEPPPPEDTSTHDEIGDGHG